jgi:hypothetical protein
MHGGSLTPAMLVDTCRDPQGAGNWDQSPAPSAPQQGRTRETLKTTARADPWAAWKCTYKEPQSGRGAEDGLRAYHHSSSAPASLPSEPPSSGTTGEKTLPAE